MYNPFDRIVTLTYDKRLKETTIVNDLKKYGWESEIFLAGDGLLAPLENYDYIDKKIEGRQQAYNYSECLKKILTKSKVLGHRQILFLEDDADLLPEFEKFSEYWAETNEYVFDMLYLGPNFQCATYFEKLNEYIIHANYILDMQAVVFYHTCFDKILNIDSSTGRTLDGVIADKQKSGEILAMGTSKALITQKDNFSFNEMREVSRRKNHIL